MALSEQKIIDKIEIAETGAIQVREATRILKDGEIVAQTFHRWSFAPGSDISTMPINVQSVAKAAWTDDVISSYKDRVALMEGNLNSDR
jgi:hypothetical protein